MDTNRIANWLTETDRSTYGWLCTYVLLLFTVIVALSPIEFSSGPQAETPATIFSWLPESIIRNGTFFLFVRVLLIASAVLWAIKICHPWSCWATVVLAFLYWALRMENLTNGAHIFHATSMLLLIHAAWFHFYHQDMNRQATDGSANCYPRWVFLLSVFYLGWFHSLAGFTKIATSGFGWGNGVSLQLWVDLFGWKGSPLGQLLLFDSRLTAVLQTGALVIECASVLVVFNRWLRYAIGFGLFGFYLGVLTTFVDFGFHFNAILVLLFLLPVDHYFGLFAESKAKGSTT